MMIRWKQMVLLSTAALLLAGLGTWVTFPYWVGRDAALLAEALLAPASNAKISLLQLETLMGTSAIQTVGRQFMRNQWPIVREVPLDDAGAEIRSLLTSPWTYGDTTEDYFDPEWALRVSSPGHELEFVISLACSRIRIWDNGKEQEGPWLLSRRGKERLEQFRLLHVQSR
jgi:hypothetical protein